VPAGYRRHDPSVPELRAVIDDLARRQDWSRLEWSGLVEGLLRLGRTDIPLGRLVEGHVDAVRILDQAGVSPRPGARYGVWASRSAGTGLAATDHGDHLTVDGTIRFASGAGVIDRSLVPVWVDADQHLLVDLAVDGLPVDRSHWHTSAMRVSQTHTVTVDQVVVSARDVVGPTDFYLRRPGFLPGGVGVAAVWTGGLGRVVDIASAMLAGRPATAAQQARLGRAHLHLVAAVCAVRAAATRLDEILSAGNADADAGAAVAVGAAAEQPTSADVLAAVCAESRAVVAQAVVAALAEVRALAGPAGLAFHPDLGHALDDLGLYAAQLNLDGEVTRLGAARQAGA
jgi:hypothetical protein